MERIGRLGWIQMDCHDPRRLAVFWGAVFGVEIDRTLGESAHYVVLAQAEQDHPPVSLQRVPDPKTSKNRLHFDILVDDVERATAQIEALGGQRLPLEDFQEYGLSAAT